MKQFSAETKTQSKISGMPQPLYFLQSVQTGFEALQGSVNVFWSLLLSMSEASGPLRRTLTSYFVWSSSEVSLSHINFHGEQRDSFIVLFTSRMTKQPSMRLPLLWLRRLLLPSGMWQHVLEGKCRRFEVTFHRIFRIEQKKSSVFVLRNVSTYLQENMALRRRRL
jgi:hypothetical protein